MDAAERQVLEEELAAELAALILDEENTDDVEETPSGYVRLDVSRLLHELAQKETEDAKPWLGSSKMLRATVTQCEKEVFGAYASEMEDLQRSFELTEAPVVVEESELTQFGGHKTVVLTDERVAYLVIASTATEMLQTVATGRNPVNEAVIETVMVDLVQEEVQENAGLASLGPGTPIISELPNAVATSVSLLSSEVVSTVESSTQAAGVSLHEEQERVRLKVQEETEQAVLELSTWMDAMQIQWQEEERQRLEKERIRQEHRAMQQEEQRMKRFIVHMRTRDERRHMEIEDALAHAVETRFALEAEREGVERHWMASEEAREWRRIHMEQDLQRKALLIEETSRLRRWWLLVMDEFRQSVDAKKKAHEAERRRELREMTAIRAEEAWQRRLMAQVRAVQEHEQRLQNRRGMEMEDAFATQQREDERQEACQLLEATELSNMQGEDIKSHEWNSAFRGFFVRRKFQNALELAKQVNDDEELDEVNLDDLIQCPPELEDDWERPVLPPRAATWVLPTNKSPVSEQQLSHEEPEEDEELDEDIDEDYDDARYEAETAAQRQPAQLQASTDAGGGSLASSLWNRMPKKARKQQAVQEERRRQQDPSYRMQKLLVKTAGSGSGQRAASNNQAQQSSSTTVSWSTNTEKKKAPKVKLPSLVERLRKKTAAAR
ncbi:hypothetical protein Poli38472_001401 [Pythium oligandrum]|uniref:Uncharacterized protein n=1 Tax=Pythium oligandrum TaxID=41045 RepID=A0A8K1CV48_PYTOL|nr:hypothetical protein Poli38472_001401 [Pythium oligandrum]|eukprot:TMW69245.1 hypothetical protein Poli38472_001401 [Pythium oligandrum]